MKVVILAGGLGSRLAEETAIKPKPMVEIGGHPVLWHIMKIYASAGFSEFVFALGYKGEVIKDYFINFLPRNSDFTIDLGSGEMSVKDKRGPRWKVHLIDTGSETQTGGRLLRLKDVLDGERFMLTYGDGVARIDAADLLSFHMSHGKLATVTAVRPPARFGAIRWDQDGLVESFLEKPQVGEGWINGGFFVFEPDVFRFLDGDGCILEHQPLERLCSARQLAAYPLNDFWQPMDTLREKRMLEDLWISGDAPWKTWN